MFELATEGARYEAGRALRQFDNIEPENRLVARTWKPRWKPSWPRSAPRRTTWSAQGARRPVALTEQELAWITTAGADLRAVFDAPRPPHCANANNSS